MMAIGLFVAGILLAVAGNLVAVGAAAVSRLELSRWVAGRHRGAAVATALLAAPGPVIGTAGGVGVAGTLLAAAALPGVAALLEPPVARAALFLLALPLILIVVVTVPRAAGRRWAEPVIRAASPWLGPAARWIGPLLPAAPSGRPADLRHMLREDAPHAVTPHELAVISGVLAFTERPVRDAMTPRTEIVAAAEGAPRDEVAMVLAESGYSRVPVYRESLDQILGIVHAFDLLSVPGGGTLPLRPVSVVPASRRCVDLLVEMQREHRQFAVVLDEFGGTAGIVTFEDLLEELVGEIFDEHDLPAPPEPASAMLLELPGTAQVDEAAAHFGVQLPSRPETVGGLLAGALGRIPRVGERVLLGALEFDVLAASPTRVERVVVRRAPVTAVVAPGAEPDA